MARLGVTVTRTGDLLIGRLKPAEVTVTVGPGGTATVWDIDTSGLGRGMGGRFLAETLQEGNVVPAQVIFEDVVNRPTVEAFEQGRPAADSVLGRTAAAALAHLGLQAAGYRWEKIGRQLRLVVDVK